MPDGARHGRKEEIMAKVVLIDSKKKQYKANLHCHSVLSDGALTPEQLKEAYKAEGYSVLAITDHCRPCDHSAMSDEISETLLCEELSGYTAEEATEREPLIENRRRYATERGYGYKDESGAVVIEAQYSYAEIFTEGRAVVRNAEHRAGVIDRRGREIVALCYDEAIFDVEGATIWVSLDGRWSEFDYNGIATGEWRDSAPLCAEES